MPDRYRLPDGTACPGCGYDLGGLEYAICPECGKETPNDELSRVSDLVRLASLVEPTDAQAKYRRRLSKHAGVRGTAHMAALILAAVAMIPVWFRDAPGYPDLLGPFNQLLLVTLSFGVAYGISGRIRKPDRLVARSILIRRLWMIHLPWISLMIVAWGIHLLPHSASRWLELNAHFAVVPAAIASLPIFVFSIRDSLRRAGVAYSREDMSTILTAAVLGWIGCVGSCTGPMRVLEF